MRWRKEFGTKMKGVAGSWTDLHVAVILDKNYVLFKYYSGCEFKEAELRGGFGKYGL